MEPEQQTFVILLSGSWNPLCSEEVASRLAVAERSGRDGGKWFDHVLDVGRAWTVWQPSTSVQFMVQAHQPGASRSSGGLDQNLCHLCEEWTKKCWRKCYGEQACRSGLSQQCWRRRTAVIQCRTQIPCIANQGHLWDCSRNGEVMEGRCVICREKSSALSRLSSGGVQTSSERCQQDMQEFLLPPGVQTGKKKLLLL